MVKAKARQDRTGREFARILQKLPQHLPVSDAYEEVFLPGDHWRSSQQEHLAGPISSVAAMSMGVRAVG